MAKRGRIFPPRNRAGGFIKLVSTMSGDGDEVVERADIATLDYEPELCYVAGKRANGVRKAEAMDYISGRYVVFEPGDLIAMGAPSGVAVGRRTRRSFI